MRSTDSTCRDVLQPAIARFRFRTRVRRSVHRVSCRLPRSRPIGLWQDGRRRRWKYNRAPPGCTVLIQLGLARLFAGNQAWPVTTAQNPGNASGGEGGFRHRGRAAAVADTRGCWVAASIRKSMDDGTRRCDRRRGKLGDAPGFLRRDHMDDGRPWAGRNGRDSSSQG